MRSLFTILRESGHYKKGGRREGQGKGKHFCTTTLGSISIRQADLYVTWWYSSIKKGGHVLNTHIYTQRDKMKKPFYVLCMFKLHDKICIKNCVVDVRGEMLDSYKTFQRILKCLIPYYDFVWSCYVKKSYPISYISSI